MQINWKVRLKNKMFWVTIIPTAFMTIQTVLDACGVTFDLTPIQDMALKIVDVVFILMAGSGVVIDMTTKGISDSDRAMGYEEPN